MVRRPPAAWVLLLLTAPIIAPLAIAGCGGRSSLYENVSTTADAGTGDAAPDAPPDVPPDATPECSPDGIACMSPAQCCSNTCENGVCGGLCAPDGTLCQGPAECCSKICGNGVCGAQCVPKGSLCTSSLQCCTGTCENGVCGSGPCQPDGSACTTGDECCAGLCVSGLCGKPACFPDGAACVNGEQCCIGSCSGDVCALPAPCAHDVCTEGVFLAPDCDPCVTMLCEQDPFCCVVEWDDFCVLEVPPYCGQTCSTCTPDGGMCSNNGQCCNGPCTNGVCSGKPPCTPDGGMCSNNGQCCNGQCTNGVCLLQPECPSDGTACSNCLAQNCCSQLTECLGSPACAEDISCFLTCVSGGQSPPQCAIQCIQSQAALQVLICIGGQCSSACF